MFSSFPNMSLLQFIITILQPPLCQPYLPWNPHLSGNRLHLPNFLSIADFLPVLLDYNRLQSLQILLSTLPETIVRRLPPFLLEARKNKKDYCNISERKKSASETTCSWKIGTGITLTIKHLHESPSTTHPQPPSLFERHATRVPSSPPIGYAIC